MNTAFRDMRFRLLVIGIVLVLFAPARAGAEDEPYLLSGGAGTYPGDFFRDKFACVQWVEKKAPDSKCLECHPTILSEKDLAELRKEGSVSPVVLIHAQHMRSGKVNFTCVTCHKHIDPYQTSSVGVRNQVPANMCFKCHFPHGQE